MSFGLKIGRSSGVKLFGCFPQAFQNKGLPLSPKNRIGESGLISCIYQTRFLQWNLIFSSHLADKILWL
jgi:hypothetical protein